MTPFDLGLELRQALEGNRDRLLDAEGIERAGDPLGEERAVHAHLENHAGEDLPDFIEAGEDEGASAVRVMHIAGPVPDIKHLAGLGNGAKLRVVAPLSFFCLL